MTRCLGCGIELQTEDSNKIGYTKKKDSLLCERCFRIQNYNEYKLVKLENYENILNDIGKTNDLVLLIVDLFNPGNINKIVKHLNNFIIVFTKRDLLPKVLDNQKILNYFKIKCLDKIIISSNKNYNLDNLLLLIEKYKKSNKIYIVGFSNSGKSTLINKLLYNYSFNETIITTSNLPSTTLDQIEVKLNGLTIIDTPGLIDNQNIINYLKPELIKKINPIKEIKPITYQIKELQTIVIDNLIQLQTSHTNLTFYFSNQLHIKRYYKKSENYKRKFKIKKNYDLVINGLGFIKISKDCVIEINCLDKVGIYVRKSLI